MFTPSFTPIPTHCSSLEEKRVPQKVLIPGIQHTPWDKTCLCFQHNECIRDNDAPGLTWWRPREGQLGPLPVHQQVLRLVQLMVYLHSPTHISDFFLYGMNLSYDKNTIDAIFVFHAVQHLINISECVNTP
jgi:hypothetical protein